MSLNGGYRILNLHDNNYIPAKDYDSSTQVNDYLFPFFSESDSRKPVLVTGIVINGVEKADVFASFIYDDTNTAYVTKIYGYELYIADDGLNWMINPTGV